MFSNLRRYFLSGLLVWLPIWVTFLAVDFLIRMMDQTLTLLPKAYQPDHWLGVHIPGIGVLITLGALWLTGLVAANFLGRRIIGIWDRFMERIPIVRALYSGVKSTMETILNTQSGAFKKVLLVEFPRAGAWTIAFQAGSAGPAIQSGFSSPMLTVFVPTTPNPMGGFLFVVPRDSVREVAMSIDEALKMVISMGTVQGDAMGEAPLERLVKNL